MSREKELKKMSHVALAAYACQTEADLETKERLCKELERRPTEWAYLAACRALHHWRAEAHRLGQKFGEDPEPPVAHVDFDEMQQG